MSARDPLAGGALRICGPAVLGAMRPQSLPRTLDERRWQH